MNVLTFLKCFLSVFKDVNTPSPFVEDFSALGDDGEAMRNALPDHIYMDCMGFGMGCCCLQVTFQACNIEEARLLYDQLTPLCPILVCTPLSTGSCTRLPTLLPAILHAVWLYVRWYVVHFSWHWARRVRYTVATSPIPTAGGTSSLDRWMTGRRKSVGLRSVDQSSRVHSITDGSCPVIERSSVALQFTHCVQFLFQM